MNTGDMKYQHTMKNKLGGLHGILTNMNTGDMKYQHTMKNTLGGLTWYTYKYEHRWYEVPTHNEE